MNLAIAGAIAGAAIFWLMYFDLKDSLKPEPRRLLLLAFGLGALATPVALGAFTLADRIGLSVDWALAGGQPTVLFYCLSVVGPAEEGAKFLAAWLFVFRWREFDERIDGLVYAAAVALGFASIENFFYLPQLEGWERWGRAIASPLTHSVWAAVWGFGYAHAKLRVRGAVARCVWVSASLFASMLLHGLYDAALLVVERPWLAAVLVLVLWIAIIVHARRLIHGRAV